MCLFILSDAGRPRTTLWPCSEKLGRRVIDIEKIGDYPFFGEGLDPHLM